MLCNTLDKTARMFFEPPFGYRRDGQSVQRSVRRHSGKYRYQLRQLPGYACFLYLVRLGVGDTLYTRKRAYN